MSPTYDVASVIALLRQMLEQQRVEEALEMVAAALKHLCERNTELQLRLGKLLKYQYGRKSEKLSAEQLSLFLEQMAQALAPPAPPAAPQADAASASGTQEPGAKASKSRQGHERRPLPAELPRETLVHRPAPEQLRCEHCGAQKMCIGHEKSEVLEFVPGHFKVQVHLREKHACARCAEAVVIAPAADKVIDSGLPGPGLLADVLVSKYRDALPLHRLSKRYERSGVQLPVSTLADWVGAGADALKPIAQRILAKAVSSHLLQTDDTGLRVLDREHPAGIKKGYMWVYLGDSLWAAFRYTPDWKSDDAQEVLEQRRGWLMHDGYAGYEALHSRPGATALEVGCWSHYRRGYVDCLDAGDVRAAFALQLIGKLFEVERVATQAGDSPEERLARRQVSSRPLVKQLGEWMEQTSKSEPLKSTLAKAIAYGVNRWQALQRFLEDGRLPLDNNGSERAVRAIATGRKNYLFAGSDVGAQRAAIVYTVISTCVLSGVEPFAYLRDVLGKLAGGWPQSRLDELLPPHWKAGAQQKPEQEPDPAAAVAS